MHLLSKKPTVPAQEGLSPAPLSDADARAAAIARMDARVREARKENRLPGTREMRIFLLLLVLLAALAAYRVATQAGFRAEVVYDQPLRASNVLSTPAVGAPALAWEGGGTPAAGLPHSFFDFGEIPALGQVQHDFLLVNRGDAPLVIERAYTTCGCTIADFSASVIPPGKASRVTVSFDAGYHSMTGVTVRRGVIIESSDPLKPQLELWVQASIR